MTEGNKTKPFRWISMFAGSGCGDLGLHRAGHEVVAAIEWDKQAAGVFSYNFPNIPIWSDISKVMPEDLPDADGVIYSFPCQDLSVAGKRSGFDGERSNLYGEAIRIIQSLKDRGLRLSLAENVPGLLSSSGGSDFERLLLDLLDVGHTSVGWTILDSQHVGFSFPQGGGAGGRGERRAVPQRRRRVFVLGTLGRLGGESIAEIFSLKHRLRGHLEEGRQAKQDSASSSPDGSGADGKDRVVGSLCTRDYKGVTTFCAEEGKVIVEGADVYNGAETGDVAPTVTSATGGSNTTGPKVVGQVNMQGSKGAACADEGETSYALCADNQPHAVCSWNGDTTPKGKEDVSLTLRAQQGGEGIGVATENLIVRRITPLEAERLQGLSDGFTQYRDELELVDNKWVKTGQVKEVADGPRYKMLGNGITAHVTEWLARRISLELKL